MGEERRVGTRALQKRRWDIEGRGVCACGAPCSRHYARCDKCARADRRARRELRRSTIKAMRDRGASLRQIAAALSSTANSIGSEITHMRRDGWDL
jgi:hypothetical protein